MFILESRVNHTRIHYPGKPPWRKKKLAFSKIGQSNQQKIVSNTGNRTRASYPNPETMPDYMKATLNVPNIPNILC